MTTIQTALRQAGEPCDKQGEMLIWILLALGCLGDQPVAGAAIGPGQDRPVWMFERTKDGWKRRAEPIAHSVSSLGLGVVGDRLVLTMQCFWGDCGSVLHRHRVGPPVIVNAPVESVFATPSELARTHEALLGER